MIQKRIETECVPIVSRFSPTIVPYEVMVTEEISDDGTAKEVSREKIKWCSTVKEFKEQEMTEAEIQERDALIDELVAKGGPTTGQIKTNRDSDKVARLLELGWAPNLEKCSTEVRLKKVEDLLDLLAERTDRICDTLQSHIRKIDDHEKRITACSVRR